jgi:hypothetical protein
MGANGGARGDACLYPYEVAMIGEPRTQEEGVNLSRGG